MISEDNFHKFAKCGTYMYHKEFVALFHTFLSSGINLTNTFGVKFGVLNGPPVCQMTECPLDLTLSSFVGTRSTCCPVKTMYSTSLMRSQSQMKTMKPPLRPTHIVQFVA